MIKIPDVQIICVDNSRDEDVDYAREVTLSILEPHSFLHIQPNEISTTSHYSYFILNFLHNYVETEKFILIQWDGFPINKYAWTDEFLDYDYIGAPWDFFFGNNVGNGGFSLRSKKLMSYMANLNPIRYHPEDLVICREYYELLSKTFKFAPLELAEKWSYEKSYKYTTYTGSFGFHRNASYPDISYMKPYINANNSI